MIRSFIDANRRVCWALQRHLPQAKVDLQQVYEKVVSEHMNAHPGQLVVDVGGGRACPFAKYRDSGNRARIVALDVSAKELALNRDVDETRVANIMRELPFGTEEVDMIVSRSVLEHLEDLEAFVANSARVVKPGGMAIHCIPSRFAPFAILNRVLPHSLTRRLLNYFEPFNEGICGFPAFYDHCYYSAATALFRRHGFDLVDVRVNYYQSKYYDFFVPFYLVSVLYELVVRALGARNMAASLLIVARRTAEVAGGVPSVAAGGGETCP